MKRKIVYGLLLLMMTAVMNHSLHAQDYSPTTTDEVYDFSGFSDQGLLTLFYNALQEGRNYPTAEAFEEAGIQASDIAFVRSHVRRASIMSRADRLIPETYEHRNLWMNIPTDIGSGGASGYPTDKFHADVYSMWQYTHLFGSWNHGIFQVPGAWVDAAHRNGTDIMSGIKFFESWTEGSGDGNYSALITQKDDDGNFKFVKPLIHCLMYFGSDGINYNWEDQSYADEEIIAFHKELYKYAREVGFDNYHSGIYTSVSYLDDTTVEAIHGSKQNGKTHDTMLNYASGGDFTWMMSESVRTAEQAWGSTEGLYAGVWMVSMDRGWHRLDFDESHRIGLCLWGEHNQSRIMSYNTGDGAHGLQQNYQCLLERMFSGGHRNPLDRPQASNTGNNWEPELKKAPLSTFAGLSTWIPERSVIYGTLPFRTHFTLGNGERYFYKGKTSYKGHWYNMGAQDVVPTYRWLICESGTSKVTSDVQVDYTHEDAYMGGSSLLITGKATEKGSDIILFKTGLSVGTSTPYARLALKTLQEDKASHLSLILRKNGNAVWHEYPLGILQGNTWEEIRIALEDLETGDVIERIGLRVQGNEEACHLYVGKLELNDHNTLQPAEIKELFVEVKKETQTSMALKMHWEVEALPEERAAWNLLYNDEANIDHFEILYKEGEDGRVSMLGTTSQWATYVGRIEFSDAASRPYVGVRAVSSDLKTYSPVKWVEVVRAQQEMLPPEKNSFGTYGECKLDVLYGGADVAREQRYVTSVTTTGAEQNLSYVADGPVADGSQHVNALDYVLKVSQGQVITVKVKCADHSSGLKWCVAAGWMDFNGSGDFDRPLPVQRTTAEFLSGKTEVDAQGERVFYAGTLRGETPELQSEEGMTFTMRIPQDAVPGESRFRIVFVDAWAPAMLAPYGSYGKGYSIDFGLEIAGSNAARVVVDTKDKGEAEEPEDIHGVTDIQEEEVREVSAAAVVGNHIQISHAEKVWVYSVDGRLMDFADDSPSAIDIKYYPCGIYLVKMLDGCVMRSVKLQILNP